MKVLSFEMNGVIYLLGDYDMDIHVFETQDDIEGYFEVTKRFGAANGDIFAKAMETHKAILSGNPKMHDIEHPDDLFEEEVIMESVVVSTIADGDSVALSLFPCSGVNSRKWRDTGVPFVNQSACAAECKAVGTIFASEGAKKAISDGTFISPKVAALEEWRFVTPSNSIH